MDPSVPEDPEVVNFSPSNIEISNPLGSRGTQYLSSISQKLDSQLQNQELLFQNSREELAQKKEK
jgi:hypothetical protein